MTNRILPLLFFLGVLLALGCPPKSPVPSIVLVTVDTLRPEYLGCYGNEFAKTPTIDRWAREGVVFRNCVSSAPLTLPSHASIMTGLYPPSHGVRHNGIFTLSNEHHTLAETFRQKNWLTAAFIGAYPLHSSFGLNQGFGLYDESFPSHALTLSGDYSERDAESVLAKALPWLEDQEGQSFFLWIHLFDPHSPYEPPPLFQPRFLPGNTRESRTKYNKIAYTGEIEFVDQTLSKLDAVLRREAFKDTLLIFTSDHGESLGDHGEPTHGAFVYNSTMGVPLVVWSPSGRFPSHAVNTMVGLVDIAPTLWDVTGIQAPQAIEGRSLKALLEGQEDSIVTDYYGESMAASYDYSWAAPHALWRLDWKYIDLPRPEAYQMSVDFQELHNRVETSPEAKDMAAALSQWTAREASPAAPSAESLARLQSLGYLGLHGAVQSQRLAHERDPKDRIAVLGLIQDAEFEAASGRPGQAVLFFEEAAALDPENYVVRMSCLHFYDTRTDAKALHRHAQSLLALGFDTAEVHYYLGRSHEINSNFVPAETAYRQALSRSADYTPALIQLGIILANTERLAEAENLLREGILGQPDNVFIAELLGAVLLQQKDFEKARQTLERALASDSLSGRGLLALGMAYEGLGDLDKALQAFERAAGESPENPAPYFNAARVLLSLERQSEARMILETFLQRTSDPELQKTTQDWLDQIS